MEAFLKYPIVFASAALTAALLASQWGPWALRHGLVDRPGGRKIHTSPVPYAGGVAIFLAFHVACAVVFLYPWAPFSGQLAIEWWWRFIPLSIAVVSLGFVDDRWALSPWSKLMGQIAISTAAYFFGLRVQNVLGVNLPVMTDFIATIGWFLLLMNSFNLIDGVDGLATGIAFISSIGIGISLLFRGAPGDVLLLLGLAGACLGFLRYNFYPARIFLGDTGSLFLGFSLAALAISTSSKGPTMAAIGVPLLAVGVPLFDTLLAIWRRSIRRVLNESGEGPKAIGFEQADKDHLHHRLLRTGRDQSQVAYMLYGGTAVLATVGILVSVFHDQAIGILALAFFLGGYTVVRHLAWIELRDSGKAVLRGITLPVRRNRTLLFYVVSDLLILSGALLVALFGLELIQANQSTIPLRLLWLRYLPFDIGLPFLFLVLFRAYSRVWYLARISEYFSVAIAVLVGCSVSYALQLVGAGTADAGYTLIRVLLVVGISAPLVVGVRASLRIVQDLMCWLSRHGEGEKTLGQRALLCGAGYQATLFLRQLTTGQDGKDRLHVIGLVDNDDSTKGHYIHGYRILGNFRELGGLIPQHGIQVIYIVERLTDEEEQLICSIAIKNHVTVRRWSLHEEELVPAGRE